MDARTLYDEDFVAWSKQQAEALRSAARTGSNHLLDWENLAEEIEGLGISQRSALASYIMRIIQHLAKLEFSPAVDPRNTWRKTIRLARIQAERRLEDNPSLKAEVIGIVEAETRRGLESAFADLEEYGEMDEVGANTLRRAKYTPEQILGDWFPPEPKP
jgi:DNA-binding SARP family transcriptional activator